MQLPTPNQRLERTRADFIMREFRQLIKQKGLVITWDQTIECPCNQQSSSEFGLDLANVTDINAEASSNNPDCPSCAGTGLIRHSSQQIQAICTNAAGEELNGSYGVLRTEEIKLSLEPEHLPSYGDRFKLNNSVIIWREINTVDSNGKVQTTRPIISRTLDLLNGQETVGVLYIHKTDANGAAPVDGAIPSTDFQLDANGLIEFTNAATAPVSGTRIAVAYYANPTYIVVSYPHTARDTVVRFQQQEIPTAMVVQVRAKMEIDNA